MSHMDDFHDFERSLLADWMISSKSDYPNLQQQIENSTTEQNHALLYEMSEKYQLIDSSMCTFDLNNF